MKSLFVFHRDLSVIDNIGLLDCLTASDKVYCIFIFTPEQANPTQNKYFSINSFSFMINSLRELSREIKVSFFYEHSAACIARLIKELDIDAVWENADHSPFAIKRQKEHARACKKSAVEYHLGESITIAPMGEFTHGGKAYVKFTPFYTNARVKRVKPPRKPTRAQLQKISNGAVSRAISRAISLTKFKPTHDEGGRAQGLKLLKEFAANKARKYSADRDYPAHNATSKLGPHLHFGTITPREVIYSIKSREFIKQIYWREFYMYISHYVVKSFVKKNWTTTRFNSIHWSADNKKLLQWKRGKTGAPIVDAGMRELLQTGRMHNRLRMICAMYLIHYLGIHWREGERWFAQNLMDYSYANNYGGWVWCAGFEVYANPYFRVFSMEQQNRRFDPKCEYIYRWCPELKTLAPAEIFKKYKDLDLDQIRKKRITYLGKF